MHDGHGKYYDIGWVGTVKTVIISYGLLLARTTTTNTH